MMIALYTLAAAATPPTIVTKDSYTMVGRDAQGRMVLVLRATTFGPVPHGDDKCVLFFSPGDGKPFQSRVIYWKNAAATITVLLSS